MGVLTLGEDIILSNSNTKVTTQADFDDLKTKHQLQKDTYYVTYDSDGTTPSTNYGKIFASDVTLDPGLQGDLGSNVNTALSALNDKLVVEDITSEFTFANDISFNVKEILKQGNEISVKLRFNTPSVMYADKVVITIPSKYAPKSNYTFTPLLAIWDGEVCGIFRYHRDNNGASNTFDLVSTGWKTGRTVGVMFNYFC